MFHLRLIRTSDCICFLEGFLYANRFQAPLALFESPVSQDAFQTHSMLALTIAPENVTFPAVWELGILDDQSRYLLTQLSDHSVLCAV
jgi:hypothetical protein